MAIEQFNKGEVLTAAKMNTIRDAVNQAQTDITTLQTNSATKTELSAATTGSFYGYAATAENLPADASTNGYAYVGTAAPYAIYNYTNGAWTNSGSTLTNPVIEAVQDSSNLIHLSANGTEVTDNIATPKFIDDRLTEIETDLSGLMFDVSEANGREPFDTLTDALDYADDVLLPEQKKGGMTIKYVQSSDNNYVQYRCIADEFTTNTDKWAIAEEGVYVENPEFVYVKTDREGKILWAIKIDGGIYYGAGVPQQVIDYINEKIAELSLDEYEDIVAFLNGLEEGEQTLQQLLNEKADANDMVAALATKVDKVEGKGLSTNDYTDDEKAVVDTTTLVEIPEYMDVETDADNKILGGRKVDGTKFENNDVELNGNVTVGGSLEVDGVVIKNIEDPEDRSEVTLDAEDKIISYRNDDGTLVENVGIESPKITTDSLSLSDSGMTEFQQALKDSGFRPGGAGDWSDYISNNGKNPLTIPVPRLAFVNFTNEEGNLSWPTSKTSDFEAIMEFSDMQGNYFKKNIIFNAQGNSSMAFMKKNGSVKMFDDSVYNSKGKKGKGDKFGVKFGDWVSQTTYHLKAFYTDYFKGVSWISYQIALDVANTHNIFEDRTWKKGLFQGMQFTDKQFENPQINDQNLQIDNGALCQPDGFPCIVHLNGEFYGIYVWLIKKDAANFNMEEDNAKHIHLDGNISDWTVFNANGNAAGINWNPSVGIEVRNPEDLIAMVYNSDADEFDIAEYDSDLNASQELAGIKTLNDVIPEYSSSDTYDKTDIVQANNRIYMSLVSDNINHNPEDAECETHGDEFDSATDYWIDITFNNEVKRSILLLSTYKGNISSAVNTEDKKSLFEEYFDLDNQVDYLLIQAATSDTDGMQKNWQWTTWNGVKWFVNNYDKDCSFGNSFEGTFTQNAPETMSTWILNPNSFNVSFLGAYYISALNARWKELVNLGIFTKEYFIAYFREWTQRIGAVNYSKEYKKWTEAPCNRDSGINTEYWKYVGQEYTQTPQSTYSDSTNYIVGDTCVIGQHSYNYTFECVKNCIGQNPLPLSKRHPHYPFVLGYRDNLWRVSKFIEKNLNTVTNFVNQ